MRVFRIKAGQSAVAVAALSLAFLTGCEKESIDENEPLSLTEESQAVGYRGPEYVANEVLVRFKPSTSKDARTAALSRINGTVKEHVLTKTMEHFGDREGFLVVHTPMAALEAISRMNGAAEIEYAEPNYIYYHNATSDDPYYTNGSLWGMYGDASTDSKTNNQYGSQAAEAWANNHTGSSEVVIGIIDEGVMFAHEDLAANMWRNPGEVANNGDDDDGNGYIDDVYGWDFDRNDNSTYDGTSDDHGTHVAGTIGAVGGNTEGVAGVTWNVKMITVKFLGRRGGTTANAIKAVDYVTNLKIKYNLNLPATNNSWGGGGFSQGLYDAIERANNKGILFIAAAGNGGNDGVGDNNDTSPHYPSSYSNSNIIAVASITKNGLKSGFSNYGIKSVDLGAPGSGIYSTLPGRGNTSTYGSYSGTSMATPHVTGAAALYAASNTTAATSTGAAAIKKAILDKTVATSSLGGITVTGGRLDVSGF